MSRESQEALNVLGKIAVGGIKSIFQIGKAIAGKGEFSFDQLEENFSDAKESADTFNGKFEESYNEAVSSAQNMSDEQLRREGEKALRDGNMSKARAYKDQLNKK